MDKRFVKLGEKYYVVEMQGDKGLTLVPATDKDIIDEQFEAAALLDIDTDKIGEDNFLQQIIDSTKDEMVQALKHGLKKTVLRSLGFSDHWTRGNGFEVDHCNQRMNEVSNHIKVTLQEILRKVTVEELGVTDEERAEMIAAMRKDVMDNYKRTVRDNVWRLSEKMAAEDIKKVADSLITARSEYVGAIVLDKLFKSTVKKV